MTDPASFADRMRDESSFLAAVRSEVQGVIVGQEALVDAMLIGLLADGHVLLEGVPGLAKSMAVQAMAVAFGGVFNRVQFTPDLLPSDLLGTQVYNPRTGEWSTRKGPVFGNFILADEINRAPAKVQSALLEAMQERSVTMAGETHPLPDPFLVLATQNPLEQEGTYPLPEAQMDRFMLKVSVTYPNRDEERVIIERMAKNGAKPHARKISSPDQLLRARRLMDEVFVDDKIVSYILDLIFATREPQNAKLSELSALIQYGASPRASIAMTQAARARAFIDGRAFVTPHDVKTIGMDVLRHRVITTFEAEAEGVTAEDVITRIFDTIPIPT